MKNLKTIFIHILMPVTFSTIIYILFRKETLLVFKWIENIGLFNMTCLFRENFLWIHKFIPDFVLYSLPDGIWVYSSTYALILIWGCNYNNKSSLFWILSPIVCCFSVEILQGIGFVKGTFCFIDLICYVLFFLLSILFSFQRSNYETKPKIV